MTSPLQELYSDFDELWQARRAMDKDIAVWASSLTDELAELPLSFHRAR